MWKSLASAALIGATLIWGQFFECHDDPAYDPEEGPVSELQFTWLGALQYIHVKNGTPHYFRVPRVILVTRQFVVSTADDASSVPEGYALDPNIQGLFDGDARIAYSVRLSDAWRCDLLTPPGNVVFADYERDEDECNTTPQDVATQKSQCEPGILMMPVADVLLHPEYKHFGGKTSVALMKLVTYVKSAYVVPVCLPLRDFLVTRRKISRETFYYVDFMSDVPRDFIEEEKELSKVSLLPRELCFLYDNPQNGSKLMNERITCTTGCGFRSGAPILIHEHTGHWSAVALAQGGCPCPDPLRTRRPPAPAQHILLHPYVPWITTAIAGYSLGYRARDDPFGFAVPRAGGEDPSKHSWVGHWWMGGLRCYDRAENSQDMYRFYHEVFQVKPVNKTTLHYYLIISAGATTIIVCVKVGMPFRLGIPTIWELDTTEVRLKIPLVVSEGQYSFQVEAWGFNETASITVSSSSSSMDPTPVATSPPPAPVIPVMTMNFTGNYSATPKSDVARRYWDLI